MRRNHQSHAVLPVMAPVGQIGDREILWVRSPKGPESLEPSSG